MSLARKISQLIFDFQAPPAWKPAASVPPPFVAPRPPAPASGRLPLFDFTADVLSKLNADQIHVLTAYIWGLSNKPPVATN